VLYGPKQNEENLSGEEGTLSEGGKKLTLLIGDPRRSPCQHVPRGGEKGKLFQGWRGCGRKKIHCCDEKKKLGTLMTKGEVRGIPG